MGAYLAIKSKNLIPYPYYSPAVTQFGITFTPSAGEQAVIVSGNKTEYGNAQYYLWRGEMKLPVGTRIWCNSFNDKCICQLQIINSALGNAYPNNSSSWVFREGDILAAIMLQVSYSTKHDFGQGEKIYPMVNIGETQLPYEPYYTYKRVKALSAVDKQIATPIKNYTFPYAGLTYIAKDNVVTFGGENNSIATRSKAFSAFNKNSWFENYVVLYKLRDDDIDIEAGRYTISFNADIVTGNAVYMVCGSVGTNQESGTSDYYATIIPNSNYKGVVSHTFEVAKGTKLALLLHTSNDSVGLCTVSNFLLIKHDIKKCTLRMRPTIFSEQYQHVEYIESTGTQYIDTGVIGKSGLTAEMKMCWTSLSGDASLLSARQGENRFYLGYQYPSGKWAMGYGNLIQTGKTFTAGVDYELKSVLEKGKQELYVNNELVYRGENTSEINTGLPLILFALHINGVVQNTWSAQAKIYYLMLYDNGKLVRNFIPCYRKSDGKIGLLDTGSGGFYTNPEGTGTFKKGAK